MTKLSSHRGGHWFDPSIAHPAHRPVVILRPAFFPRRTCSLCAGCWARRRRQPPGRQGLLGVWSRCVALAVAGRGMVRGNGPPGNPSAVSAVSAIFRVIGAASAPRASGRASHNPSGVGSSPTRPTCGSMVYGERPWTGSWTDVGGPMYPAWRPDHSAPALPVPGPSTRNA